jgi:hypothetical protein
MSDQQSYRGLIYAIQKQEKCKIANGKITMMMTRISTINIEFLVYSPLESSCYMI